MSKYLIKDWANTTLKHRLGFICQLTQYMCLLRARDTFPCVPEQYWDVIWLNRAGPRTKSTTVITVLRIQWFVKLLAVVWWWTYSHKYPFHVHLKTVLVRHNKLRAFLYIPTHHGTTNVQTDVLVYEMIASMIMLPDKSHIVRIPRNLRGEKLLYLRLDDGR